MSKRLVIITALAAAQYSAYAGMTVYDLNDVVRLRLQDVSFFTVLLLLCGLGVRFLWNYVAKDLPRLPRLSFGRALALTGLLSLFMLLVLSMISGARELLTPGAWRKQGDEYRLSDSAGEPMRRQSMEALRATLMTFANSHDGNFPSHDYVPEIPEKIWQSPNSKGTRYIYFGGGRVAATNIIACEPLDFGEHRFVLFGSGEIKRLSTTEIRRLVASSQSLAKRED